MSNEGDYFLNLDHVQWHCLAMTATAMKKLKISFSAEIDTIARCGHAYLFKLSRLLNKKNMKSCQLPENGKAIGFCTIIFSK